jgi:hypothetical protein
MLHELVSIVCFQFLWKVCSVDNTCGHLTLSSYVDYTLLRGKGHVSSSGYQLSFNQGDTAIPVEDLKLAAEISLTLLEATMIPTEHFQKFDRVCFEMDHGLNINDDANCHTRL